MQNAITENDDGITINFYESGVAEFRRNGINVKITMTTDYPVDGKIKISVETDAPLEFTLKIRNPEWAETTAGYFYLVDYGSAGKDWKTPIAAWLPTK
ncbi:MAG: glycoside hydrolase family 127 protein [Clostridia bacterium]|nr:glycoside hydrolase family 127 protein [Clostridia bacterium]